VTDIIQEATENPVTAYLKTVSLGIATFHDARTGRENWKYLSYEAAVLALGKPYTGSPRPPAMHRRTPKQCFMNSYRMSKRHPNLVYCEGYAVSHISPLPVQHAWLIDMNTGKVVDLTWEHPSGASYHGILIDEETLDILALKHGVYGVLGNDYLLDAPLLRYGTFLPPTTP